MNHLKNELVLHLQVVFEQCFQAVDLFPAGAAQAALRGRQVQIANRVSEPSGPDDIEPWANRAAPHARGLSHLHLPRQTLLGDQLSQRLRKVWPAQLSGRGIGRTDFHSDDPPGALRLDTQVELQNGLTSQ